MTTDSMKKTRRFATPLTMMVGMALLACGGAEQAEPGADGMAGGAPEAEAPMTVRITEPAEGATLEGPFRVAFEVEGLTLERDPERDRKSTRLNSSHLDKSRMPSSA